jgi:hypothetical protein
MKIRLGKVDEIAEFIGINEHIESSFNDVLLNAVVMLRSHNN